MAWFDDLYKQIQQIFREALPTGDLYKLCDYTPPSTKFPSELLAMVILPMLAFFIIVYMIAKAIRAEVVEDTIKDEFISMVMELAVFLIIYEAFMILPGLITINYNGHTQSYLEVASIILGNILSDITALLFNIFEVIMALELLSRFSVRAGQEVLSIASGQAFGSIISVAHILFRVFGVAWTGWFLQAQLFCFVLKTAVPVYLPVAFVLRLFRPTKNAGGFLLALLVALYFIFPMLLLVDDLIIRVMGYNLHKTTDQTGEYFVYGKGESVLKRFLRSNVFMAIAGLGLAGGVIAGLKGWVMIHNTLKWITYGEMFISSIYFMINILLNAINKAILYMFLLPGFNFFFTVFFVHEIGQRIRADIDLSIFAKFL